MPGETEEATSEDQVQLDPMVVIESLQGQLAAKCMEVAKGQAVISLLQSELASVREVIGGLQSGVKDRATVSHNGRTTESTKKGSSRNGKAKGK